MDIRVSVVIPTYNREKTIIRCINSVMCQSFRAYEIIVVDDGSVDSTVELLKSIKCNYLKIIEQNHKGAQAARNVGIINAKGNYISFLDSDDEWLPDLLKEETRYIKRGFENHVIYSNCFRYYGNTQKQNVWILPGHSGDMYTFLLKKPGPMFQSLLVKRDHLLEIGLLDIDLPAMQEWDTFIRLAKKYEFIHVKKPLFIYYVNTPDSISRDQKRGLDGYFYVVEKHEKEIRKRCGRAVLFRHLMLGVKENIKIKRIDGAILNFIEMLKIPFI